MNFDKSRVYTSLNADELKVGSKVICADCLEHLKKYVEEGRFIDKLTGIGSELETYRFTTSNDYALAYLVEEPGKLKWTDLKVGDIIRNREELTTAMVTQRDEYTGGLHILAGATWLTDDELECWEKVEE